MNLKDILATDPTLEAADRILEDKAALEPSRKYLGASSIGDECSRKLWYRMQPDIQGERFDALSLKRFADGFHGEDVIIDRLRAVPGIEIWNRTEDGGQIGGTLFGGKFGWHVDGVILGLLQAPKTPHVLEVKVVNEKKFKLMDKLKQTHGEKKALAEWDATYYAQAVIYMDLLDLTRHYTVIGTPGTREWTSCRTDANPKMAKMLINKAERIINAKEPPERMSNDPCFFKCKWCAYNEICHAPD